MLKFQYQNGENPQRIWNKFSGLQNGAIKELQIGAGFRNYKSRQEELQIGQLFNFRVRAKKYNLGQGFQIRAKRFQIKAEITNRGKRNFKSGQGKSHVLTICIFVVIHLSYLIFSLKVLCFFNIFECLSRF